MCMIVGSANDCAYVVGRYLAGGDGDAFPAMMNRRAKELGLAGMNFNNANGLPIKNGSTRRENTGSALEVAYLALRAMKYPERSTDEPRSSAVVFSMLFIFIIFVV